MHSYQSSEETRAKSRNRLQITLTLAGWAVAVIVGLSSNYQAIPATLRVFLWVFVVIAIISSLVLWAIPIWKKAMAMKRVNELKKFRRRKLAEFSEILHEATPLFAPDGPYSVRSYLMSLCNAFVQDQSRHPFLKGFHDRLVIVTGWHSSLVKLINVNQRTESEYISIVSDIAYIYRTVSNMARELNSMELPMTQILKGRTNENRIIIEKYNTHLSRLELVLADAEKINPELRFGGFDRF